MNGITRTALLALLSTFCLTPGLAAKTLTVGKGQAFATLSPAVSAAVPNDSIVIYGGFYQEETILINKPLAIQGVDNPVFDGDSARQVITITADSVRIRGITVARCGTSFIEDRAGIKIDAANDCLIQDCSFIDNFFAVYLAKSVGTKIINNKITASAGRQTTSANGIHLWYCRDVLVANNEVLGHRDGIYFEFVENGLIRNNVSTDNLRYGLHFMFSDHCRYINNVFRRNGAGVAVMYTHHVEMDSNRFEENWGSASFGLLLKDISDSRISANYFAGNSVGVYLENSNRTRITGNNFTNNGSALRIMANSLDNTISENNFLANAFDVTTNSRNNFSDFSGNYWSAYRGYDLDRDGTGDIPFRPVRLFALIVEKYPPSLILLRSIFVDVLDVAERVFPVLTPRTLVDKKPAMERFPR